MVAVSADLPEALKSTAHLDGRSTLKLVFPAPSTLAMSKGSAGAEEFLRAHAAEFKLPADLSNLELVNSRESLLGTHYRYRQLLNGIPVEGADIIVSIRRDSGEVYQAYNNTYPASAFSAKVLPALTKSSAEDAAWNHLRVHGKLLESLHSELVYLPEKGGFILAYKTYTPVEAPFGYWEHRVDATTGQILSVRDTAVNESRKSMTLPDFASYTGPVWSKAKTVSDWESANVVQVQPADTGIHPLAFSGSAKVFDGDPRTYLANASLVDSSAASAFTAAYVTRTLQDIALSNGLYRLTGPWVSIANFETPNTVPTTSANGTWNFARGTNAFNDTMTYFHIDQSQRYLQSLGYSGATGIQYGPILTDTDGLQGDDNSHYIPGSNRLAFGHGGVDDNEDADVILHEYGHAITQSIVPSWGGGDTGAIGEGFGDYWGGSYSSTTTNGLTFHPEWAFSWDGHSADSWAGRWLNMTNLTYDSNHTYAAHETISGTANYSDQLWSAPIFQAFQDLRAMGYPRTNIDKVVLEGFFGVGSSPKMRDLALGTVNAANQLFPGQPYASVFLQRFVNQQIISVPPLPAPVVLYPAGGESLPAGSTALVRWNRQGAPTNVAARLEYSSGAASFLETVENGTNGWVISHGAGTTNWLISTAASHSATHSWFGPDPAASSDSYLRSPLINVAAGDTLSFWHIYTMESGYDGGVVEVSTNGTTWTDLGSASTQNGYNATISSSFGSAIAGRQAFTGGIASYIQTVIPLTAYAGKSIYVRFRVASDSSVGATGWYVDDIAISKSWTSIGTTALGATNYLWTVPATTGTNYLLRVQQFASGYADSPWAQSASFKVVSNAVSPSIQSLRVSNGAAVLTWSSVAGTTYRVQYKTNVTDAVWQTISPDILASGSTLSVTNQPLAQRRFFRVTMP